MSATPPRTSRLWEMLLTRKRSTLRCLVGDRFQASGWDAVLARAEHVASGLRRAGVHEGDRVAMVLGNTRSAVEGMIGTWLAGATVASLPVPARGMSLAEYSSQLTRICRHVSSPLLLSDQMITDAIGDGMQEIDVRSWESLDDVGRIDASPPAEDEVVFIQYSSGSTSSPKGCMLSAEAIAAQMEILGSMAAVEPGAETVASWLPLSHDMGTFGCMLLSLFWDFELVLSSPQRFMYSPRTWFGDCAQWGATLTAGPNSGVHFAARMQGRARLSEQLRLKVCVVGAERIEWTALTAATQAFAPYGLRPEVFLPAYGLAEATLVVSASEVDATPHAVHLDALALADGQIVEIDEDAEAASPFVSVGAPCAGVEVRLADPTRLSEIMVRTPSLASGYHGEPELTAQRFCDQELATGDLGFQRDGELYVVGRSDDLLSVAGRNVYARELESAVERLEAVRNGCCTVVDAPSGPTTRLVMLLEAKQDTSSSYVEIAGAAARIAAAKAGVSISECLFLAKGALPKTPSGKVQRFRCRALVLSDQLAPLKRVPIAA